MKYIYLDTIFVGLLIKEILLQADKDPELSALRDKTAGVMFYSTPHFGSSLARQSKHTRYMVFPSVEVQELREGDAWSVSYIQTCLIPFYAGIQNLNYWKKIVHQFIKNHFWQYFFFKKKYSAWGQQTGPTIRSHISWTWSWIQSVCKFTKVLLNWWKGLINLICDVIIGRIQ